MLEEIKSLLGDNAAAYTDAQINVCIKQAEADAKSYCYRKTLDEELLAQVQKMAIVRLNRLQTEGLNATSYSGVNETYLDGYPADIMMVLNRKRKVKLL